MSVRLQVQGSDKQLEKYFSHPHLTVHPVAKLAIAKGFLCFYCLKVRLPDVIGHL